MQWTSGYWLDARLESRLADAWLAVRRVLAGVRVPLRLAGWVARARSDLASGQIHHVVRCRVVVEHTFQCMCSWAWWVMGDVAKGRKERHAVVLMQREGKASA